MAWVTKKYPKVDLQDLVWGDIRHLKKIQTEIVDRSRWSIHYDMVFHDTRDDTFWSVGYSSGATENQDEQPFEYEGDNVECIQVKPVEQTVTVYLAVNQ